MTTPQEARALADEEIATIAHRHMLETPLGWSMADITQVARDIERRVRGKA